MQKSAAGDAKKHMLDAISSGVPVRPQGMRFINSLIMLFLLVLSPIYSNDIHLSTGDNLVSYTFDLNQSIEDGITKENLSNTFVYHLNTKENLRKT